MRQAEKLKDWYLKNNISGIWFLPTPTPFTTFRAGSPRRGSS